MYNKFFKYQANGNDFIIIDNRLNQFDKNNTKLIKKLCNRRFGIGADGLILLQSSLKFDFGMIYFNSDGNESSMCGNGGRCIVSFAKRIGIINETAIFSAIDGAHHAKVKNDWVELRMSNVEAVKINKNYIVLNTGSPHYVTLCSDLKKIDVNLRGREIRNSEMFIDEGINVNFVEVVDSNTFSIRTYERGVENETFSCGTGATATAISMHAIKKTDDLTVNINTNGGKLIVNFKNIGNIYNDIWLCGPSSYVFEGIF
tara:strand:+ start:93 stop:866 length:774 start_codon:yes stop_codon:yes gene_type:complete